MNLGELSRPITIYWDLSPADRLCPDYLRFCEQITSVGPLQLHLFDDSCKNCLSILERMQGTPLAITLTTGAAALTPANLERLHRLGLRGLLMYAHSYGELEETRSILAAAGAHFAAGIAFEATCDNWRELPQVVRFSLEQGVASLTLPMQRLYHGAAPFMLTDAERDELGRQLAGIDCSGLRLTIHDPFLWRAFHPDTPFPGGGCQAGNTMLAIAPDGSVYPCPSLPLALGSLTETTLKELVGGEAKKRFRAAVAILPDACLDCPEKAGCKGGCRGRSLVAGNDVALPDPACGIANN